MNDLPSSNPAEGPLLVRLPLALFLIGCCLCLFDLSMQSARGVGLTLIIYHLFGGVLLLLVLGIPLAYQLHTSGNRAGLLAATLTWMFVGMANLGAALTNWPLKVSLGAFGEELVSQQMDLKPGETRKLTGPRGFFRVQEIRKLENGNIWFVNGDSSTGSRGLVYVPADQPVRVNIWSDFPVMDRWHMVEED